MPSPAVTERDTSASFLVLDDILRSSGPQAVLERLAGELTERGEFRALLDAMLLRARHELGLPLIPVGGLSELPEPARSQYEERYVAAIQSVGRRFLDAGDIPGAWPYFRAIGETEPVAQAIEEYQVTEADERLGQVVEVAFSQGANPRRGFELILNHYGTCSAISAFEQLPYDEATRIACADRLVRQVHSHLASSLRADIAARGEPEPPSEATVAELVAGRDWLFDDDAYHIDVSHLGATVRLSPLLTDPESIALAVGLTDYGRHLSDRHHYEGDPPFERTYEDHGVYLRALVGKDVDAAVAHFRAKLVPANPESPADSVPAQVLVRLLVRLGRLDEAIGVAAEHLAGLPESSLSCPGVAQLCQRAGQPARLARIAREHGDLVNYAAALLQCGLSDETAGST
jgi:hypothetical protein